MKALKRTVLCVDPVFLYIKAFCYEQNAHFYSPLIGTKQQVDVV